MHNSDGRNKENPAINYGTGGLLVCRNYLLTTSWNAPKEAFTLPGEFFDQKMSMKEFFGFHKAQAFVGLKNYQASIFMMFIKIRNYQKIKMHIWRI